MEPTLKIRLTHMRAEGATIEVLNLPGDDLFMSPLRLKVLGETLIRAASVCAEKIRGRMQPEPIELEFDMHFLKEPIDDDGSLLIRMVNEFGVRRFTPSELDQVLNPNRHPGFGAQDLKAASTAAFSMVRRGLLVKSRGPNGGQGWLLRDAAVASAKRLAKTRPDVSSNSPTQVDQAMRHENEPHSRSAQHKSDIAPDNQLQLPGISGPCSGPLCRHGGVGD